MRVATKHQFSSEARQVQTQMGVSTDNFPSWGLLKFSQTSGSRGVTALQNVLAHLNILNPQVRKRRQKSRLRPQRGISHVADAAMLKESCRSSQDPQETLATSSSITLAALARSQRSQSSSKHGSAFAVPGRSSGSLAASCSFGGSVEVAMGALNNYFYYFGGSLL